MNDLTRGTDVATHHPVIVIGGGQAGLSASWCLTQRGISHLVLEKHRVGHEWRTHRWDSFCLVTPNWQCQLPGFPYQGDDPYGFMRKGEIVEYVESYARSFGPPLREGVAVTGLRRLESGLFEVRTDAGLHTATQVIVAAGGYQIPVIPRAAERIPDDILQIHSADYKSASVLPEGDILVVGSGQSGCQIAEDLHLAGRRVHLATGSAPRSPRVYRGKDVVEWLHLMGYYDMPIHEHPLKERVRQKANHYLTGRDGGREIDLRKFAAEGMQLYGRFDGLRNGRVLFRPDLRHNLDQADAVSESIKATIDKWIAKQAIEAPVEPPYVPAWAPDAEPVDLDLEASNVRTVIWCIGFRTDFRWIEVPVFDGSGYPVHARGVTTAPGLYFLGLPWLYTWGSGRFSGVARDAQFVVEQIDARLQMTRASTPTAVNELALGS
jgi:putative flavoprotein involved in K+ transport